jgi:hypothetical protein
MLMYCLAMCLHNSCRAVLMICVMLDSWRARRAGEAESAAAEEAVPWEGAPPARYYLQARRDRLAAGALAARTAGHPLLKVQPAVELPRTIDEILKREPKHKKAARAKPGGGGGVA